VGIHRETLVDPSRLTPANGTAPGQPDRRFPVAVWYPARGTPERAVRAEAAPDRRHGPYPLVVFVHGFTETPDVYADLLARVAAAGYIVAAPALPLSNGDAPGGPSQTDVPSHPEDVRFVLTQLLTQTTQPDDALHGLITADRIAVAGHSMGGSIAYSLGFESCCRDPRVLGVLDFSQLPIPLRPDDDPPQAFEAGTGTPVLFINGDRDEYFPPDVFTAAYTNASVPKYEITLVGASHKPPYQRRGDQHFAVVVATTIDFLDAVIGRHPDPARLASHLRRDIKSAHNIATLVFATQAG
jgi:pimeloyl-ACP methyl ester carboxylesterase